MFFFLFGFGELLIIFFCFEKVLTSSCVWWISKNGTWFKNSTPNKSWVRSSGIPSNKVNNKQLFQFDCFWLDCVTVTVDNGKLYLFDIRTSWAKPSLDIHTEIPELYTSERCGSGDVFLGYGNGRMEHYDLRTKKR